MKETQLKLLVVPAILLLTSFVWIGCQGDKENKTTFYTVSYTSVSLIGEMPISQVYEAGAEFVLPSNDSFSRTGYRFVGWNDGTTNYTVGDTYTMPKNNVSFSAVWENVYQLSLSKSKFIYNGFIQKPEIVVKAGNSEVSEEHLSFVWSGDCINVGEYSVTISGTGDFADISLNQSFEIIQKPITVTLLNRNLEYGDNLFNQDIEYYIEGAVVEDSISVDFDVDYEAGDSVGEYVISADVDAGNNYDVTLIEGTLSVLPRELLISITAQSVRKGTAIDPNGQYTIVSGLYGNDQPNITITSEYNAALDGLGQYALNAQIAGELAANYLLRYEQTMLTVTGIYSVSLGKDNIKLTMGLIYGQEDMSDKTYLLTHSVTAEDEGMPANPVVTYNSADDSVVTVDGNAVTAVGEGTTQVQLLIDSDVYANVTVEVKDYSSYTKVGTKTEWEAMRDAAGTSSAENKDKKYVLVNDIDFNNSAIVPLALHDGGTEATGYRSSRRFWGTIDGNGHSVKNFKFDGGVNGNAGLYRSIIGVLGHTGVIRNIGFINIFIVGYHQDGIVSNNFGLIENVYATVSFNSVASEQPKANGGLVGVNEATGKISNAIVVVENAKTNGDKDKSFGGILYAGMLAGRNNALAGDGGYISNSYAIAPYFKTNESGEVTTSLNNSAGVFPLISVHANNSVIDTKSKLVTQAETDNIADTLAKIDFTSFNADYWNLNAVRFAEVFAKA